MDAVTPTPPKTHAEVADAIVERAKARGKGMVIVDREYEGLENDIATALRDEYERGLTIGYERGQGWAKTREGAMARAGLVFDGEDKIVTRSGKILDDAGNVRRDRTSAMQDALIQARGALLLDHMVDKDGKPYGTTVVALEAIDSALHAKDAHAGEKGAAHEG